VKTTDTRQRKRLRDSNEVCASAGLIVGVEAAGEVRSVARS
jgi:hypothetical protein